ncbi:MAG: hypothetical protein QOI06_1813 [Nocardioidaceae bacterium]|jgi:predicted kinase|nr:hypothetical protein [Nocardioidaceae bacterium]
MTAAPVVLVTGVPGAGKSTLAAQLATALSAGFLSLDEVKESLYAEGVHMRELGALRLAAEHELAQQIAAESRAVVVDIWVAPGRDEQRTAHWVGLLGRPAVEVLCRIPGAVAVDRYRSRRRSGPHLPPDDDTVRRIEAAAVAIAPLGLGATIEVETLGAVDVGRLAGQIVTILGADKATGPDSIDPPSTLPDCNRGSHPDRGVAGMRRASPKRRIRVWMTRRVERIAPMSPAMVWGHSEDCSASSRSPSTARRVSMFSAWRFDSALETAR